MQPPRRHTKLQPSVRRGNWDVRSGSHSHSHSHSFSHSLSLSHSPSSSAAGNILVGAEKVLATLRMELFRTLLMQKISYFDRHSAAELTGLISVELDAIRSFVFRSVRSLAPR